MNKHTSYKTLRSYMFIGASLLLTCRFEYITTVETDTFTSFSDAEIRAQWQDAETFLKKERYRQYFDNQKFIYQTLVDSHFPGIRSLDIDEDLAETILETCPEKIKDAVAGIEQEILFENEKNIILHGMSGTGKSCLAQAIAIKTQCPCVFFNVGGISTEYMNSGVQNLNAIFAYAQTLTDTWGKPCIVILDELESLTKKHVATHSNESNILINFWQQLDKVRKSNIIVIGTMNNTDDLPVTITNRTSMIKIPLPDQQQREKILTYYLQQQQNKYHLLYPQGLAVVARRLAAKTDGFSNRDLHNLVTQTTKPFILSRSGYSQTIVSQCFDCTINQIKNSPQYALERQSETWLYALKKYIQNSHATLSAVATALSIFTTCYSLHLSQIGTALHKESLEIQKESMKLSKQQAYKATTQPHKTW